MAQKSQGNLIALINSLGYLSASLAKDHGRSRPRGRGPPTIDKTSEASWWAGSELKDSGEETFLYGFENYQLDGYWSDRMTWALKRSYAELDKAEFYFSKTTHCIDVVVLAYVESDITIEERNGIFSLWKSECEVYYRSSDEFLDSISNRGRGKLEFTSRLNLLQKGTSPEDLSTR